MNSTMPMGMKVILQGVRDIIELKGVVRNPNIQITVALTLFFILCLTSYGIMTITRKARLLGQFSGVWKFPLVGSAPFIPFSPERLTSRLSYGIERFGRVFTFWLGHTPYVVITDADAVQKVLSSSKYIEKGRNYDQFHWLLGNGLITSNGQLWKEDRKLLSPSFKYQRFDGFLGYFNKHSKVLVEILDKAFARETMKDKAGNMKNKDVDLHPYLSRATMDFISESAFGISSTYQFDIHDKFLEGVHLALNSFRMRVMKPWLVFPIIWDVFGCGKSDKVVTKIFTEIMKENIKIRREILENSDTDGATSGTKPFLDSLLQSKSNEEICGHIATIFGAGFETTASGMNYLLYLPALNPSIQAKVHAEIDSVLSGPDSESDSADVTFTHLAELKYLEMCIKEALRLYPPAPVILRHAVEDIPLETGQIIPKGVEMIFFLRNVHMDPKHFPNPEEFDPERFLPENCATRHPYSYVPFSAGPRNCLGLKYAMVQMKCCLGHILRHFKVSTQQLRREEMKLVYGMVLETIPTIKLFLTKR